VSALRRVVVVGGGLAGHAAVTTLRREGYDGAITLLTEEEHPPYDRPPLSKEVLRGDLDTTTLDADYDALAVEVHTTCAAERLRPGEVVTATGTHGYDGLVVATGSEPLRLPGQPAVGVFELRTLADALRLRAVLGGGQAVAVVGAGWIGAEVATIAAARGSEVTVVDAASTPLAGALPAEVGRHTEPWYAEHGIDLRLDSAVTGIDAGGVDLAGGDRIDADVVVVGIGARPRTAWLAGSGLTVGTDGALVVDALLSAGPAGVYGAGDIVRFPSERSGGELRVEHWEHAAASGRAAARNLLGAGEPYDPVPYFWSDQLGHRVQYVGHHGPGDRLLYRGRPNGGDPWTALWLRGDALRAVLAVDRPRDVADARRLLSRGAAVRPQLAADPAVRLAEAAVPPG
jgi:NADPH-dependent 2,4-dienoyl-CoA reductase/sulfur reductase-like enzyme